MREKQEQGGVSSVGVARSCCDGNTATADSRDDLIAEYYGFVEGLVSRMIRTMGLPERHRDDFVAAGLLGLVEAAGRFDAGRGHDFRAYAFLRVRGSVIDHIRNSCDLSGYAYRMLKALEAAQEVREQSQEAGRAAGAKTKRDRAAQGIDVLAKSAMAFKVVASQDRHHMAQDSWGVDPESALFKKELSEKMRHLVATLPEKERTIIEQYYFCDRSLREVAEVHSGLSKSWVSRLHDRALGMLREKMVADKEADEE